MDTLDHSLVPRCVILVGDYGSGKTEVAVNLSLYLAGFRAGSSADAPLVDGAQDHCLEHTDAAGNLDGVHAGYRKAGAGAFHHVAIADLDLVNPYFRCREALELMEQHAIEVIVPGGGHRYADLPILLPQVKGLLQDDTPGRISVLDVGGDDVGARVLAGISDAFRANEHGLWFVANGNRPFCDTPKACVASIRRIEGASGLRVSGLVANTHLIGDTTVEMVRDGVTLAEQVCQTLGIPIRFVAAMDGLAQQLGVDHPVLCMRRWMVPPWLRPGTVQIREIGDTGPDAFRLRTS